MNIHKILKFSFFSLILLLLCAGAASGMSTEDFFALQRPSCGLQLENEEEKTRSAILKSNTNQEMNLGEQEKNLKVKSVPIKVAVRKQDSHTDLAPTPEENTDSLENSPREGFKREKTPWPFIASKNEEESPKTEKSPNELPYAVETPAFDSPEKATETKIETKNKARPSRIWGNNHSPEFVTVLCKLPRKANISPFESSDSSPRAASESLKETAKEKSPRCKLPSPVVINIKKVQKTPEAKTCEEVSLIEKLHQAIKENNFELVKDLVLEKGASINNHSNFGITALHTAVVYGKSLDIVRFLTANGADVNAKSPGKLTALHMIAEKTTLEARSEPERFQILLQMAKILIEKGADLSAQDIQGNTPLHYATTFSTEELVKLFLRGGAARLVKSNTGRTAYNLAKEQAEELHSLYGAESPLTQNALRILSALRV